MSLQDPNSKPGSTASNLGRLGNGLVEVSAVATLIGAPIAEALTLGLRSAACLPWASMSAFGLLHVAKAALAAAVPDYLRDSMGLHNANVVAAVGFYLPLTKNNQARRREDLGDIQAILTTQIRNLKECETPKSNKPRFRWRLSCISSTDCEWAAKSSPRHESPAEQLGNTSAFCVYGMDRTTRLALETIPPSEAGKPIVIHEFVPDRAGAGRWWTDYIVLLISAVKVAEFYGLRRLGSKSLHWFTTIGWLLGVLMGFALLVLGLSRDNSSTTEDVIAGRLPSALHLGGDGKILLRVPQNVRRSVFWKITWYAYSVAAMAGIVGTFLVLGNHPPKVVYTWMAFQLFWLGARTVVYYFVDSAVGARQGLVVSRTWQELSTENQLRIMRLCEALAEQQATTHPRGAETYRHDLTDTQIIRKHLTSASWKITSELRLPKHDVAVVKIFDVIGDNFMRTMVWVRGEQLSNSDLYDSALAFLEWDNTMVAVPCVRSFACNCNESIRMRFRGDSHGSACKKKVWVLWIPASIEKNAQVEPVYLYVRSYHLSGTLDLKVLTVAGLNSRLAAQEWNVCFTKVGDLEPVEQVSRRASFLLCSMLQAIDDSNVICKMELAAGKYRTGENSGTGQATHTA
ncbi:hypothetical protein BDW02DRAFT_568762 [Decorospora gaudefroyi]|uniref:Uncharacterized protein n=1 Tax=Decorospora gaudefroyi TaxID=184978 RepID=A0A6A5KEW4_9PLEO|nr:hypothetical protein BDW02DRAFT_568762 [Decorospora gaudefroyi]